MALILHAGAQPIDYERLKALPTPEGTDTHVPIPHVRIVDLIVHSLAYFGHEVTEQHYGVTEDGMNFFGCITLKSSVPGFSDMVALRNSHSKKFPVGIGFGSVVMVCDNMALIADHVIKRKHTPRAKMELPGLLMEIVEPLQLAREQQHRKLLTYQGTPLSEAQADHAIMQMYRQDIINVTRIADVEREWQEPSHDWGDKTVWRLFNATTFALTGRVLENPQATPKLHQILDGVCHEVSVQ